MQVEVEAGDHAKVATATAHTPVQLRILLGIGAQDLAAGRDDLHATHVVEREPEATGQAAEATAQREAADACVGDRAGGRDQAVRHGFLVEVAQQAATGHPGDTRGRIDADTPQQREVQQQAPFTGRFAGGTVAAAFDREQQVGFARELDGIADIGRTPRLNDEGRPAVHLCIPDAARAVIARATREDEVAAQALAQFTHGGTLERDGPAVAGDRVEITVDGRGRVQDGGPATGCRQRSRRGQHGGPQKPSAAQHARFSCLDSYSPVLTGRQRPPDSLRGLRAAIVSANRLLLPRHE